VPRRAYSLPRSSMLMIADMSNLIDDGWLEFAKDRQAEA
jgi:hypothetical protein